MPESRGRDHKAAAFTPPAKSKATEAKGAWRQVTGETYGSEKAKTWTAPVPAYDAEGAAAVATELKHIDIAIGRWQETIGELQGQEKRLQALDAKGPALEEHAARCHRIRRGRRADSSRRSSAASDRSGRHRSRHRPDSPSYSRYRRRIPAYNIARRSARAPRRSRSAAP